MVALPAICQRLLVWRRSGNPMIVDDGSVPCPDFKMQVRSKVDVLGKLG
jgi:hypothetical protein